MSHQGRRRPKGEGEEAAAAECCAMVLIELPLLLLLLLPVLLPMLSSLVARPRASRQAPPADFVL